MQDYLDYFAGLSLEDILMVKFLERIFKMKKDFNRRDFIKVASAVTITASLFPSCSHKPLSDQLDQERIPAHTKGTHDYIVIGSGAGGGPLACRLVEAGFRVLLLEAGGENSNKTLEIPVFHGSATELPECTWEFFVHLYSSRLKRKLNSKYSSERDGIFYPRASGLGGCTVHNAMIFMYPENSDWNHLAYVLDDTSWSAREMRKYFQRFEKNNYREAPRRSRSLMTLLNREKMGFKGWLSTEQTSPLFILKDPKFIKIFFSALVEEGIVSEVTDIIKNKMKLDPNTWSYVQNKLDGIFNVPKSTKDGLRSSTRDFILETKRKYPHLLTIKLNTLVEKILVNNDNRAYGVLVREGKNLYKAASENSPSMGFSSRMYQCQNEVVLSAGAFNSPQILMLSGIGNRDSLSKFGIETKVNLPGVGRNLQDRYEVSVVSKLKSNFSALENCSFGKAGDQCLADYYRNPKEEIYGTNGVLLSLVKRSHPSLKDPNLFIFALPGRFKGYYQGWSDDALTKNYLTWAILKGHTQNQSGHVTLKSSDPTDTPIINFKYFHESVLGYKHDLHAVRTGVETARRMNNRISHLIDREVYPGTHIKSESDVNDWIQNEAWGHHASCSNKIGNDRDPMSVLDKKFRVRGVDGLRVVDASTFNRIPGLFIVCPIYMISEKAADVIIDDAKSLPWV